MNRRLSSLRGRASSLELHGDPRPVRRTLSLGPATLNIVVRPPPHPGPAPLVLSINHVPAPLTCTLTMS
ncbi:unnamed protein product [Boreogadus saida]